MGQQLEKNLNANYDEYLAHLEQKRIEEIQKKQEIQKKLSMPPPPPPPAPVSNPGGFPHRNSNPCIINLLKVRNQIKQLRTQTYYLASIMILGNNFKTNDIILLSSVSK